MTRVRLVVHRLMQLCWSVAALFTSVAMAAPDIDALKRQVAEAERSFARTMAERDHAGFVRHLSDEALFFSGAEVLHGKAAVAEGWRRFFEGKDAPFSWEPDQVAVLADGTLALSTGPVRDPQGKPIARFNSVWRFEPPGVWRIVFDKGGSWSEPAR